MQNSKFYLRMLCDSDVCRPNFDLLSLVKKPLSSAPLVLSDTELVT